MSESEKKEFAIFDFCQNFEFFNENPDGLKTKAVKSLTQQTFEVKLEIAVTIRERIDGKQGDSNDEQRELAESYVNDLHQSVAALNQDRFVVKSQLRYVIVYGEVKRWANVSKSDMLDINTYGDKPLGECIRGIVGLDKSAAQAAFAAFIQAGNLQADQITFINNIINYLSTNGTIDKAMLFQSPFTFAHQEGLLGVFDDAEAEKVIRLVDTVNNNAVVCASV